MKKRMFVKILICLALMQSYAYGTENIEANAPGVATSITTIANAVADILKITGTVACKSLYLMGCATIAAGNAALNATSICCKTIGRFGNYLYHGKEHEVQVVGGAVQAGIGAYLGGKLSGKVQRDFGINPTTHPAASFCVEKGLVAAGTIGALVAHDAGYHAYDHPYLCLAAAFAVLYGDKALSRIGNALKNNKILTGMTAVGSLGYYYGQQLSVKPLIDYVVAKGACNPLGGIRDAFNGNPWKTTAICLGIGFGVSAYHAYDKMQERALKNIYDEVVKYENWKVINPAEALECRQRALNNARRYRNKFFIYTPYYYDALLKYFGIDAVGNPDPDNKIITFQQITNILWGIETAP